MEKEDKTRSYTLPNNQQISVQDKVRYLAPEIMFQPHLLNDTNDSLEHTDNSIHKMIYYALQKSQPDIRNELYNNIVISGGNTLFDGFE